MLTNRRLFTAGVTALVLAGCGGGDEGEDEAPASGGASAASAPSPDAVLACLKEQGLDAKDQSTSTGKKIGIDLAGGRLVISFEDSEEEAKTYASVAETNGETAVVKGSVAITVPDTPTASTAQPTVERCVESP